MNPLYSPADGRIFQFLKATRVLIPTGRIVREFIFPVTNHCKKTEKSKVMKANNEVHDCNSNKIETLF